MMDTLSNKGGNDVDDTMPTYKVLEEGSLNQTKEELTTMAARQQKFIQSLQAALVRIENKTYGICRVTGKLGCDIKSSFAASVIEPTSATFKIYFNC